MTPKSRTTWALYYERHRDRILREQRKRYRSDHEYRERKIRQATERYAKRVKR